RPEGTVITGVIRLLVVLGALGFAVAGQVQAGFTVALDGTATPQAGGYAYSYTLTNQSTAGELVFDLSLAVNPATTLSGLTAPPAWAVLYPPGDPVVEWLATPAGSTGLGNALVPGGSLSFSYFSTDAPGPMAFTVLGDAGGELVLVEGVVTPRLGGGGDA